MGFLKLTEFAARLHVSRETAALRIRNGEYPAIVSGKSYKIPDTVFDVKEIKEFATEALPQDNNPVVFMFGNNKGGATKTTSTLNVAASLAFYGYKVLVVDNDTQSNASMMVSGNFKDANITKLLYEMDEKTEEENNLAVRQSIVNVEVPEFITGRLDLLPNSLEWDMKKEQLIFRPNAENMLERLLRNVKYDYDFIIIDTAPSMDVSWRMSIMAADAVIITMKAEQFSINGLGGVFDRIYALNGNYRDRKNRDIFVLGATIADYSKQTTICNINAPEVKKALQQFCRYNDPLLFEPFITHTIKAFTQQTRSGPIIFDEPGDNMSYEYLALTKNILFSLYESKAGGLI